MRVHILQHAAFEGLGCIAPWLEETKCKVTKTSFFESTSLPPLDRIDLIIVLGGPMSVNDEEHFPWFRTEKQFLKNAIASRKAILGICLGAQLLANCMGEPVYPNRRKEIGWFPVKASGEKKPLLYRFPPQLEAFHWHGDTFDLPDKAILLATSEACENQAFQIRPLVIGLQFHLELTPELVKKLIKNCRQELLPSLFVQPEEVMLDQSPEKYRRANREMINILNYMKKGIEEKSTQL
ncbi:type 1 glutamine amidotransferase [Desulforhopalus singaporensis]|uniref:GMP synthase-Glutamine amidotransferase n=1 Tax=Desulforhopalus singaporensis TaxID=91360 RepID=A0A1H0SYZ3_9BACT|nr:type 1 glutamine amidotransferase [Desulforhopalus singaporensis]SDP47057.1 GMP synthase-Glutamine amidotransferase [Desulforhopalus singaporensis]